MGLLQDTPHSGQSGLSIAGLNLNITLDNPMVGLSAPILGKPILPAIEQQQVMYLIERTDNVRDKAIIALFAESGLRLSGLVDITLGVCLSNTLGPATEV